MKKLRDILYIAMLSYLLTGAFFIPWDKLAWPAFWRWIVTWPVQAGDKAWYLYVQWAIYFLVITLGWHVLAKQKTDRTRIIAVVAILIVLSIIGSVASYLTGL